MLCMHHISPNRHVHPSGGSYSWLFAPDRGGNRPTKLCLERYLSYSTCYDSTKKHQKVTPEGAYIRQPLFTVGYSAWEWTLFETSQFELVTIRTNRPLAQYQLVFVFRWQGELHLPLALSTWYCGGGLVPLRLLWIICVLTLGFCYWSP